MGKVYAYVTLHTLLYLVQVGMALPYSGRMRRANVKKTTISYKCVHDVKQLTSLDMNMICTTLLLLTFTSNNHESTKYVYIKSGLIGERSGQGH